MNASEQAKAAGLKSLAQVSKITGVSVQTLNNWHKNKPDLFAVVLAGCSQINCLIHGYNGGSSIGR